MNQQVEIVKRAWMARMERIAKNLREIEENNPGDRWSVSTMAAYHTGVLAYFEAVRNLTEMEAVTGKPSIIRVH